MQNNAVGLNHELNTLYNQDFFVADTTGRRLSQIVDKSNYSSLLPNRNAALQLRLPDLLIYLKTDTYLIDVKTGHHYAVYHNRVEKMSVLPKLYAAWPYRQLLQAICDDAVCFGVNSPEPDTSIRRPNAAGTPQCCSLQGGTAYTEKSTHTSHHKTSAYARGRQRIQTHSRTTSVRLARAFVESKEHGHSPHPGATFHGDIYGSRSITPTAKR